MLTSTEKLISFARALFAGGESAAKGPEAPCISLQNDLTGQSGSLSAKGSTPASESILAQNSQPGGLGRILRPAAAMRWSLPMVAMMTPQMIENILRGAISGDHVRQWELFDLMLDTWPELSAVYGELVEGVMARSLNVDPFSEEGSAPTQSAMDKQRAVASLLRSMSPDALSDENDMDGTIRDLLDGWFRGVVMLETQWHTVPVAGATLMGPRCTSWAHPSYYTWGQNGRLSLVLDGNVVPPQPHRFLAGIHKSRAGSPLGTAVLRPLAWWWCAANFASDWLLNLAQIFGLPFRWANHDPNASQETVDAICNMLQNMGSAGWAAFPEGTTLELKEAGKTGDASPQGDLLDRADRYARTLILGQTLSGGADASKGGGKAFGGVEAEVKAARIDAAARYVSTVINTQLIPSIIALNWGYSSECPAMSLTPDEDAGLEQANRDSILAGLMPLSISALRAKYKLAEPAAGEEATTKHQTPPPAAVPALAAKLASLCEIEDEAIFAKELAALTETL